MDIFKALKEKVKFVRRRSEKIDLSDLILHLERAEFYFHKGIETQDNNYFTDVIYRTNQAFEGGLREAYKVLVKKPKVDITAYEIERYLLDNKLLKPRVLSFFTNYRQNWRNESTHNYQLFFNESEAFIAITTVLSFSYILINQMLEALAFQVESMMSINQEELKQIINDKVSEIDEKVVSLIKLFYAHNLGLIKKEEYSEVEIIGLFTGFLSSSCESINIINELPIEIGSNLPSPDLVFELNSDKVIIEFKRNRITENIDIMRTQLIKYLFATEIRNGVIFYYNLTDFEKLEVEKNILIDYDTVFKIMEIY